MAGNGGEGAVGKVTCAAWIRRREDEGPPGVSRLLVAFGRGATASSPPLVDLLEFDARASALASEPLVSGDCFPCGLWDVGEREGRSDSDRARLLVVSQARVVVGEEAADTPRAIAVHPGGRELVCATAKGCR